MTRRARLLLPLLSVLALSACAARSIFYFPNKSLFLDPHTVGLDYQVVYYPSFDGKKLCSLLFRTKEKPKGIIVHLHGNYGNVSYHFGQSVFLLKDGYDVLVVDYQGYGGSEGKPTPQRAVEDGRASVRYALSVCRSTPAAVGLFGQSIGAAAATVVAAEEPEVKGVVLESGFASFREISRDVLKRSAWTWPLAWVLPPLIVRHEFDPKDSVAKISPRPVFFLHGTADRTVPSWMTQELYDRAKEPKELWLVPGADHLQCRRVAGPAYEERIVGFFDRALTGTSTK